MEVVPDACQIVRGTTGNGGDPAHAPSSPDIAMPQLSSTLALREPKLPKVMWCVRTAQCQPTFTYLPASGIGPPPLGATPSDGYPNGTDPNERSALSSSSL